MFEALCHHRRCYGLGEQNAWGIIKAFQDQVFSIMGLSFLGLLEPRSVKALAILMYHSAFLKSAGSSKVAVASICR
jgi:hypothetical protein